MGKQLNDDNLSNHEIVTNKLCIVGFWMGIASIFLSFIGIIPLTGLIISIIGLVTYKKERDNGFRRGIAGLILNLLYLLSNASMYGHIG